MNYIKNLTFDESHLLILYLSKDKDILKQQINILNNESEILSDPVKTLSAFNTDTLLKSVYDLAKIETLSDIVLRTPLGELGFYNKKSDMLGSSLNNIFYQIYNSADVATRTLKQAISSAVTKDNISYEKSVQDRQYITDSSNLVSRWIDEKAYNILNKQNDIFLYKQKIAQNHLLNLSKTAYMSIDYISYYKDDKTQDYIEIIYQSFLNLFQQIIDLKKLVRRTQDVVNKYHINIFDAIVPAERIEEINKNITAFINLIQENYNIFLNKSSIEKLKSQIFTDNKERQNILAALEEIKSFAGSSIKQYSSPYTVNQEKSFIESLKSNLQFILSVPLYYTVTAPVVPVKYTTQTREILSNYHDVTYPLITVDSTGNKADFLDEYIKNKLI